MNDRLTAEELEEIRATIGYKGRVFRWKIVGKLLAAAEECEHLRAENANLSNELAVSLRLHAELGLN